LGYARVRFRPFHHRSPMTGMPCDFEIDATPETRNAPYVAASLLDHLPEQVKCAA